jgi:hypothetical protein
MSFWRRRPKRSVLGQQIAATLLPGMTVPEPLEQLFQWIEQNNLFVDQPAGRIGFLFPEAEMEAGWTDHGRPGGTRIEFFPEGNLNLRYWFGNDRAEILSRLCVFCKTGAEGSMGAFWLDDEGKQRIVHMGSGSGSIMVCVLANDAVDFLRLLAIGYDEICWGDFHEPPEGNDAFVVGSNHAYRTWVETTFGVRIPDTGREIVAHEGEISDMDSPDPFARWAARMASDERSSPRL